MDSDSTIALNPVRSLPAKWRTDAVEKCDLLMSERRTMKRLADELEAALSAPRERVDGCKCVCHSMKAGMVHSHDCCVSPVSPTPQERDAARPARRISDD